MRRVISVKADRGSTTLNLASEPMLVDATVISPDSQLDWFALNNENEHSAHICNGSLLVGCVGIEVAATTSPCGPSARLVEVVHVLEDDGSGFEIWVRCEDGMLLAVRLHHLEHTPMLWVSENVEEDVAIDGQTRLDSVNDEPVCYDEEWDGFFAVPSDILALVGPSPYWFGKPEKLGGGRWRLRAVRRGCGVQIFDIRFIGGALHLA